MRVEAPTASHIWLYQRIGNRQRVADKISRLIPRIITARRALPISGLQSLALTVAMADLFRLSARFNGSRT